MYRPTKWVAGLAGLLLALAASAQSAAPVCNDPEYAKRDTVAELREVQGNVLVSDAAGMSSGVDKQRLKNMVRVTTTSRASSVVVFDCGCEVRLKENERLDVQTPSTCAGLLAAVQTVPIGAPIGAVAAPAAGGISTTTGALVATGVGVGAYLLYRNNRNVSPN